MGCRVFSKSLMTLIFYLSVFNHTAPMFLILGNNWNDDYLAGTTMLDLLMKPL